MAGTKFGYENLDVWQEAVSFAAGIIGLVENITTERRHFRLLEQIEASAASVAANIAEGKGRFSKKEFTHFLYVARGSLYETMTFLAIFKKMGWLTNGQTDPFENQGKVIVGRIKGLINSIADS